MKSIDLINRTTHNSFPHIFSFLSPHRDWHHNRSRETHWNHLTKGLSRWVNYLDSSHSSKGHLKSSGYSETMWNSWIPLHQTFIRSHFRSFSTWADNEKLYLLSEASPLNAVVGNGWLLLTQQWATVSANSLLIQIFCAFDIVCGIHGSFSFVSLILIPFLLSICL